MVAIQPERVAVHALIDPPGSRGARLRVFLAVFGVVLAVGLAYTFARPPVYRGQASVQVSLPAPLPSATPAVPAEPRPQAAGGGGDTLTGEVRVLTSAPLLAEVGRRLQADLRGTALAPTPDQVRSMVDARPIPGTGVIELAAEGPDPRLLERLLGEWLDAYLAQRATSRREASSTAREDLERQVASLAEQLEAKRQVLAEFRARHEILSPERADNEAAARLKQLTGSLAEARQKVVEAESKASALRGEIAAGKVVLRPEDKNIIAGMEVRARELREELRAARTRFTDRYLDADPKYREVKESLADLEAGIAEQRRRSARGALDEAEQELASARRTADGLQAQLEGLKRGASDFTARYAEQAGLQGEVEQLEALYKSSRERLVQAGLAQGQRAPEVRLLAPPAVSGEPVRPLYLRDAGVSLGASLVLGLVAVWLVEFLGRSPRDAAAGLPHVQITLPPQALPALEGRAVPVGQEALAAPGDLAPGGAPAPRLAASQARLPEPPAGLPRELGEAEVRALWAAAHVEGRVVVAGLMSGLTAVELADLRWEDVDRVLGQVRVRGLSPRVIALSEALREALDAAAGSAAVPPGAVGPVGAAQPPSEAAGPLRSEGWVLAADDGGPLGLHGVEGLVAHAAYEADLESPVEVTPQVLRHTYLAYLVRQGARFAEVEQLAGRLPPSAYTAYARLGPLTTAGRSAPIRPHYPLSGGDREKGSN